MKNETNQNITEEKTSKRRYIITTGFTLLLLISIIIFSLSLQKPKPNPVSDKIILEAAAQMIDVDPNYFVDNDFFEEVYHLNVSHMPIIVTKKIVSPKYVSISKGSGITPIFGLVEISDIQYIEKFPNLESVDLKIRFPQKDIPKWMIMLSKLGVLNLNKRFSIDLKPLAKLYRLKRIDLTGSQIKDIQPLEGLNELERLIISYTQVNDIRPIRKLTKLKTLDISSTTVSNFEPIGELTNLEKLCLNNTKVSNLEFVKKLTHLYKIDLRNCKNITDEQVEDLQKTRPNTEIVR